MERQLDREPGWPLQVQQYGAQLRPRLVTYSAINVQFLGLAGRHWWPERRFDDPNKTHTGPIHLILVEEFLTEQPIPVLKICEGAR